MSGNSNHTTLHHHPEYSYVHSHCSNKPQIQYTRNFVWFNIYGDVGYAIDLWK
jgi:hypothetical protein